MNLYPHHILSPRLEKRNVWSTARNQLGRVARAAGACILLRILVRVALMHPFSWTALAHYAHYYALLTTMLTLDSLHCHCTHTHTRILLTHTIFKLQLNAIKRQLEEVECSLRGRTPD